MRNISLLFLISLFSFSILSSCSSGGSSDPAPDPQAQVANFAFTKGDTYIFQKDDGISTNVICRIYYNGETWKREIVLKDLPFVVYDMAVDTKNDWLYIMANDKAIHRVKPIQGGMVEKVFDTGFPLGARNMTMDEEKGRLYLTNWVDKKIFITDLTGKTISTILTPDLCRDIDFDQITKRLYFGVGSSIFYLDANNIQKELPVGESVSFLQVYPGSTFVGHGLYYRAVQSIHRRDKNNGSGDVVLMQTGIWKDGGPIILSPQKNLIFYFTNDDKMLAVDILNKDISNTSLTIKGEVTCGVNVK